MQRRTFCIAAGTLAGAGSMPALAAPADDFPNKPVRIIVPFAAGISPDIVARLIGDKLGQIWKQPVLIENKPGAAGAIGAEAAAGSLPDGYTLFLSVTSVMAINSHVYTKLRYNSITDFMPVSHLLTVPYVLTASPLAPFNNLKELVAYAKQKPEQVNYASLGPGSQSHVAVEVWQKKLGIQFTHIPYKTSPLSDLIAGNVMLYMDPSTTAIPLVQEKKVKAIAVSSAQRISQLPNVPSVNEYQPGLDTTAWQGIFVPKGTPQPIVDKLSAQIVRVVAMPDVQKRMIELGLQPSGTPPAKLASSLNADYAYWGRVIRELGVKLD